VQGYSVANVTGPNGRGPREVAALRGWISPKKSKEQLLYVSDSIDGVIDIFSVPDYSLVGQITDGLDFPEGIATDKKGNLYVSNLFGNTVTVYPEGQTSPSVTLSEPDGPDDVAVAGNGDVLAGDTDGGVDVYKPGETSASSRLTNSNITSVSGIGIDGNDNVYAVGTYTFSNSSGPQPAVVKYAALGSSGKNLKLSGLIEPAGALVDKHGNIVISDFKLPGVNLYKPGKKNPFATIASAGPADRIAINNKQNLIYVPQSTYGDVSIFKYPSGKLVQDIPISSGDGFASGTALSPPAKL
jgi:hypothetical protein